MFDMPAYAAQAAAAPVSPEVGALGRGPHPRDISFRPLAERDFPLLTTWLAQPHVRRFYQKTPVTLADVASEYGAAIRGEEPSICHLALTEGAPFAYLQSYRNADYRAWVDIIDADDGISVDLYIGEGAYLGRGFGRAALAEYLRRLAFPHHAGTTRAYIGHELINEAALQCSRAVGFRPLRTFVEDGRDMLLLALERADLERRALKAR